MFSPLKSLGHKFLRCRVPVLADVVSQQLHTEVGHVVTTTTVNNIMDLKFPPHLLSTARTIITITILLLNNILIAREA
jgi:hypothetical protein